MPQVYRVQPNEVLSQIAARFKFRDGGAAIWQANRAVIGDNPDVLAPGIVLTIPDTQEKDESRGTGKQHGFVLPAPTKNLCLSLQSPQGEAVTGWKYVVRVGAQTWTGKTDDDPLKVTEIPGDATDAVAQVQDSALFGLWGFDPEIIELNVGGLDPLVEGEAGRIAIQKILSNLGLYNGPLDGDFTDANEQIRPAIRTFQRAENIKPAHGLADRATCEQLIKAQGNVMPPPKPPETGTKSEPAQDRSQVLPLGAVAHDITENVTTHSGYQEPTAPPIIGGPPHREKLKRFQFFPHTAFVAPANPGEEDKNPNVIRMPAREFIFLDCGRWLKDSRDFGVVWGPHVYLCQYASPSMKPDDFSGKAGTYGVASAIATGVAVAAVVGILAVAALAPIIAIPVIAVLAVVAVIAVVAALASGAVASNAAESAEDSDHTVTADTLGDTPSDRLDMQFFQQMNAQMKALGNGAKINIVKRATATWASPGDFNWEQILLVVPDLHLMNGDVASLWWQKPHDLQPELDLLDFTQMMTRVDVAAKIQFVQIGDSYDLWVGCAPRLFKSNKTWTMELKNPFDKDSADTETRASTADPEQTVKNWIGDIQGTRGNWVQRIMDRRRQDNLDNDDAQARYKGLLKQQSEDDSPTAWVCQTPKCQTHGRPEEKCAPHSCGRVSPPCPTHAGTSDVCEVESIWSVVGGMELNKKRPSSDGGGSSVSSNYPPPDPSQWHCNRDDPPCPGHDNPDQVCEAASVWKCRAISCPGHDNPGGVCTDGVFDCGRMRWQYGRGWLADCAGHGSPNESCVKPGWLNPAEAAFRQLTAAFGDRVTFIYGNHDNYLIIPEVASDIPDRARYFDGLPGVFVEHGHRMEGTFFEGSAYPMPVNFDGQPSGYELTIGLYNEYRKTVQHSAIGQVWADLKQSAGKPVADEWAGIHDQPQYRGEMAQIWLGRQAAGDKKPPHIYVIGHTHMPNLWYVPIEAWRI